jgi:hypothetical protein
VAMRKRKLSFPNDVKKQVFETLAEYDHEKVRQFIINVDVGINLVNSQSDKKSRIKNITLVTRHLKKMIEKLYDYSKEINFIPMKCVADFNVDRTASINRFVSMPKYIKEVISPMLALIKILEDVLQEEKEYRNTLLTNEQGEKFPPAILTWIADSYKKHIDPPYPYRGQFHKIIDIILGDFGDRNRSLRRAIKTIKQG